MPISTHNIGSFEAKMSIYTFSKLDTFCMTFYAGKTLSCSFGVLPNVWNH